MFACRVREEGEFVAVGEMCILEDCRYFENGNAEGSGETQAFAEIPRSELRGCVLSFMQCNQELLGCDSIMALKYRVFRGFVTGSYELALT